jgi:phospholipase C
MGFYNMARGDDPLFSKLARQYTIGDNFHQSFMGGTTANSIMIGTADALWYSDGNGNPLVPPTINVMNPNPQPGTNNWYSEDGYPQSAYVGCSDPTQPGVAPILDYLASLPYHPSSKCLPGYYYLADNHSPGYFGNGAVNKTNNHIQPPSSTPTIADVLLAAGISWTYYGEGWNSYVLDPNSSTYWNFANPFQFETAVMTNTAVRTNDLKDTTDLDAAISSDQLPAVSFVKPGKWDDGHPVFSKIDLFGGFVYKILAELKANPALAKNTAVFITFDEGGGWYDSGYIQPLDFFGDGPRIPVIVVSAYSQGGRVVHSYGDQVSILKFIEKNWNLPTITNRSRDNLPNPIAAAANPYLPTNSPAIDDMMDYFHF